jgi:hypothetical protein
MGFSQAVGSYETERLGAIPTITRDLITTGEAGAKDV